MWFYEHTKRVEKHDRKRYLQIASWDKVDHGGRYGAFKLLADIKECEVILVLLPHNEEKVEPIVATFLGTDDWRYYVMDAEGVLSYEERQLCARENLCVEKERHLGPVNTLQFWRSQAQELEGKLKKLQGGAEELVQDGGANGGVGEYL